MTLLPTGEQLPEYDDGPVDVDQMCAWLKTRRGWGDGQEAPAAFRAPQIIRDVLAALQAAGDATLVKNETYRMMRQDGARIERLAAWMSNNGMASLVVEHDGNVVEAVIEGLKVFKETSDLIERLNRGDV